MASEHCSDEYNKIVSVTRPFSMPLGHIYVSAADSPLCVLQLCCIRTLARGRILYQVYDQSSSGVVAYVVPADVSQFAHQYRHGINCASWSESDVGKQQVLQRAYALLRKRFPRMAEVDVKEISQKALNRRWRYDEEMLEEVVVDHALHEWTSYDMRFESAVQQLPTVPSLYAVSGNEPARVRRERYLHSILMHKQVLRLVKTRLREVVVSWMRPHVAVRELNSFFERHDLLDGKLPELDGRVTMARIESTLSNFGGAETIANITNLETVFT